MQPRKDSYDLMVAKFAALRRHHLQLCDDVEMMFLRAEYATDYSLLHRETVDGPITGACRLIKRQAALLPWYTQALHHLPDVASTIHDSVDICRLAAASVAIAELIVRAQVPWECSLTTDCLEVVSGVRLLLAGDKDWRIVDLALESLEISSLAHDRMLLDSPRGRRALKRFTNAASSIAQRRVSGS